MTDLAQALERYLIALLDENQRINLTGIRDLATARVLHVGRVGSLWPSSRASFPCLPGAPDG